MFSDKRGVLRDASILYVFVGVRGGGGGGFFYGVSRWVHRNGRVSLASPDELPVFIQFPGNLSEQS